VIGVIAGSFAYRRAGWLGRHRCRPDGRREFIVSEDTAQPSSTSPALDG
jgi:hypothetical protein